ncbi:hypothetical protein [Paraburkholderia azotifigens]|uniref:hypothetical protein n=1 Tax=Paraburkholderia azotifigens TaxID=2057004 RepID=UPI0038B7D903
MTTTGNANIPQPSAPFLVGRPEPISPVWWAFMLALFQRGGGATPPAPTPTPADLKPLIDAQVPIPFAFPDNPPDAVPLPAFASDPIEDIFASGVGFTPGATTVLTLSKVYATKAAVLVHFDSAFQGTDQYSVSGNKITFTSPIPVGVSNVYARG